MGKMKSVVPCITLNKNYSGRIIQVYVYTKELLLKNHNHEKNVYVQTILLLGKIMTSRLCMNWSVLEKL